MNNNKLYTSVGNAITAVTAAAAITATASLAIRSIPYQKVVKGAKMAGTCAVVLVGLAGVTLGATIAYLPEKRAKKKLETQTVLDDKDAELVNQNISEVLGSKNA